MYDECQEVEARVPVEICKRRRFDEDTIFLSRGEAMRRAGEPKVAAAPYRPSDSQQTCQLLVPSSSTQNVPNPKLMENFLFANNEQWNLTASIAQLQKAEL